MKFWICLYRVVYFYRLEGLIVLDNFFIFISLLGVIGYDFGIFEGIFIVF